MRNEKRDSNRKCVNPTRARCVPSSLTAVSALTSPSVRFSKDPKTYRARKPSRKAPETTFGYFSKHPKNFEPEKNVIFPRKLHGYSLPPEKCFRLCRAFLKRPENFSGPEIIPQSSRTCFSKHPKNFEPEKYVIFSRKFHGYSLPPEKAFSGLFFLYLRPPTYFLRQNK